MISLDYLLTSPAGAVFIGIGATLTFDLLALVLKLVFNIPPSNICLVGRWIRYMAYGKFFHSNIAAASPVRGECVLGWIAHYLIGITFAAVFVALAGSSWFENPTLIPALGFGVLTILVPFLAMQPSMGLGYAASKTLNPTQARIRTLMNHIAFGIGLYIFAWLLKWLNSI